MAAEKPHLNVVTIGHIDHGKSTLVGRLLFEAGAIDQRTIDEYRKKAEELGKGTFEFAFVMDNLKEERERGVTIDVAHKRFDTKKYYYTIIDAPGHRDFVKNMITGASQADVAIIAISAVESIQEQTREHIFLIRTLGIKQIILAVNKMDAVKYEQAKYETVMKDVQALLKTVGFKPEQVLATIPLSAYKGDNITKLSENMPWYKGEVLLEALDKVTPPEKPVDLPLRVPIQDVYTITGIGTVPVGRIETGIMKPNDKVVFQPANKPGEIKSIEMHHEMLQQAEPGDNVGFNVRGVSKDDVRRGDVCGHATNPPTVAKEFVAQIAVLRHPSALAPGYTPVFHCHTAQIACTFTELQKKMDPRSGQVAEENPQFLKTGDVAIVKIMPTRPLVIENVKDIPQLGRFAVRDMGQTVGAGVCMQVTEKQK